MRKSLVITYPGSKGLLFPFIYENIPHSCTNYYEPFVGRGNVFWNYVISGGAADNYYLNDTNTGLWLQTLKDYKQDFNFVPDNPNSDIYKFWRDKDQCPERIIIEPCICFMGGQYKIGGSRYDNNKNFKNRWIKKYILARDILNKINPIISGRDWMEFLSGREFGQNDLIYCDPPYDKGFAYKYNEAQAYENINHPEFLDFVRSISTKCKIVISGFNSPLYQEKMKDWNIVTKSRWANGKNRDQKKSQYVDEYLWRNY